MKGFPGDCTIVPERERKWNAVQDQHAAARWLGRYMDSFRRGDGTLHPLLEVKRTHMERVRDNAALISRALGWDGEMQERAMTAALLHDTGRFPQFARFSTFSDGASVDHGDLGERILREEFPWDSLDGRRFREEYLESVRLHNKKEIPPGAAPQALPLVRIVRDSDKIDVFRLVRNHVEEGRIRQLLPRIDLEAGHSPELVREIRSGGRGSYGNVHSLADFLLVQLSWAFDLNFPPSFRILSCEGAFSWIAGRLPGDSGTAGFIHSVLEHASAMCAD